VASNKHRIPWHLPLTRTVVLPITHPRFSMHSSWDVVASTLPKVRSVPMTHEFVILEDRGRFPDALRVPVGSCQLPPEVCMASRNPRGTPVPVLRLVASSLSLDFFVALLLNPWPVRTSSSARITRAPCRGSCYLGSAADTTARTHARSLARPRVAPAWVGSTRWSRERAAS
jgi:hypothetical protein